MEQRHRFLQRFVPEFALTAPFFASRQGRQPVDQEIELVALPPCAQLEWWELDIAPRQAHRWSRQCSALVEPPQFSAPHRLLPLRHHRPPEVFVNQREDAVTDPRVSSRFHDVLRRVRGRFLVALKVLLLLRAGDDAPGSTPTANGAVV